MAPQAQVCRLQGQVEVPAPAPSPCKVGGRPHHAPLHVLLQLPAAQPVRHDPGRREVLRSDEGLPLDEADAGGDQLVHLEVHGGVDDVVHVGLAEWQRLVGAQAAREEAVEDAEGLVGHLLLGQLHTLVDGRTSSRGRPGGLVHGLLLLRQLSKVVLVSEVLALADEGLAEERVRVPAAHHHHGGVGGGNAGRWGRPGRRRRGGHGCWYDLIRQCVCPS